MNQVSALITMQREKRGLNKSQAARKLGVSSQLLGQYESGARLPKTNFFLKWKQVFGEDLLKQIETNVSHETQNEEAPVINRGSLERTLENMSEDKIRSTAIIERLVALLERSFNSDSPVKAASEQTELNKPVDIPVKPIDLELDKKYSGQSPKGKPQKKDK